MMEGRGEREEEKEGGREGKVSVNGGGVRL